MRTRLLLAGLGLGLAFSPACRADTGAMPVSAVVISRSICTIFGSGVMNMPFGSIDPSGTADQTATASMSIGCLGSDATTTFSVVADSGLHPLGAGNRRMAQGTTEFLPYSLAISPASATVPRLALRTITFTGTITPAQYQGARVGAYSDTVRITLNP